MYNLLSLENKSIYKLYFKYRLSFPSFQETNNVMKNIILLEEKFFFLNCGKDKSTLSLYFEIVLQKLCYVDTQSIF